MLTERVHVSKAGKRLQTDVSYQGTFPNVWKRKEREKVRCVSGSAALLDRGKANSLGHG